MIKMMNVVDPAQARLLTDKEMKKIQDDVEYECIKNGSILHIFIVKNSTATIGAEPASIFITTPDLKATVELVKKLKGQKYHGRDYRLVCIPHDTYNMCFRPIDPTAPAV